MEVWSPILAMAVGLFALHVHQRTMPVALRRIEEAKGRMPTKQIYFEDKIRNIRRGRRWVGVVVVVQVVLSIVLWTQYFGK